MGLEKTDQIETCSEKRTDLSGIYSNYGKTYGMNKDRSVLLPARTNDHGKLGSPLSSVLQHGQWHWPAQTDTEILEIMAHLPQVHQNTPNAITWRNTSGQFSVQSAIQLFQPRINRVAWHGLLHSRYKIPRHVFILWLAFWEKLSTMDKNWISRGDNGCVLCDGQHVEAHDHLFFNCQFSRRCLQIVQRQVRFHWPHSGWQQGIHWASKRWRSAHLLNEASRALLAALVYHLWTERNNRKFRATQVQQLKQWQNR
ncbi:UNVERIFIED_CONTAM: hypothetical protein Scaly_1790100 [Sesamum calycinum]|uniref:Reverse transcriptase zinc-binding domain-containing protein n=1 Tax=Sesamum calycinum TaxID=2727403 RepID=A0AAW2NZB9_9LAMI